MRESIVRTVAVSVIYAILEAHYIDLTYGGNLVSPYHLLVFLLGVVAGFDRDLKVWTANSLTYSVLEDVFYWVFKSRLPYQWSPEYVVIGHVPVYYVPYSVTAVLLYMKGMKDEGKSTKREPGRSVTLLNDQVNRDEGSKWNNIGDITNHYYDIRCLGNDVHDEHNL